MKWKTIFLREERVKERARECEGKYFQSEREINFSMVNTPRNQPQNQQSGRAHAPLRNRMRDGRIDGLEHLINQLGGRHENSPQRRIQHHQARQNRRSNIVTPSPSIAAKVVARSLFNE